MKNAIITLCRILLLFFGGLIAIALGYAVSPYGGLVISITLIFMAILGIIRPYALVRKRKDAAVLIILALFGLGTFSDIKKQHDARVLASLKTSDSKAYLEQLRASGEQNLYLKELQATDPQAYQAELAQQVKDAQAKIVAQQEADREELNHLKAGLDSASSLPKEKQLLLYARLFHLDPKNENYQKEKQRLQEYQDIAEQQAAEKQRREDELREARYHPEKFIKIVDFSWQKGGFGSVMLVKFTIKNTAPIDIKDVSIRCEHSAPSGTLIDSNEHTVYEIFKSGATRRLPKVNMGFIHSQATSSSCIATSARAL